MEKQFFILLGRSGSGKGTQAELLKTHLEKNQTSPVTHITTGGGFRAFNESGSYASQISKEMTNAGKLGPEFLAIWNWSNIFITTLKGDETVILDGAPRTVPEKDALQSAVVFFGYIKPTVIYLDVSEAVSREHLKLRGREDDTEDGVTKRMEWFDEQVLPVVESYRNDPRYKVIHVNGSQTIEEVHKELLEKLGEVA